MVLYDGRQDGVVAFISAQIFPALGTTDVLIARDHREYSRTGLKTASVIRLDKVATITKQLGLGEIGEPRPELRKQVRRKLRSAYSL